MKRIACLITLILLATIGVRPCKADKPNKPRQWPALLKVDDRSRIADVPRDQLIGFALYTVQSNVLKLSAQLYPVHEGEAMKVELDVQRDGRWTQIAKATVHPIGWTATFRVENWDTSKDTPYRVRHAGGATYEGLIRHDPIEKAKIVAAVFTGNSPHPGGGEVSKQDVVDNIEKVDPDVLIFTGDQVYNHTQHTAAWLEFGKTFGQIIRNRPTVCIPDDHDAGQPNLWGGGGRKVKRDVDGGYTRPAEYVKMMERQQTSHLPDPFDPTPIQQGIGVYYTSLNVGGIDFAILEDRKFKSGCADLKIVKKGLGPRPDHINTPDYDPKSLDLPGKQLLGDRQLDFLRQWARQWNGSIIKAVVSQTAFNMTSTHHGGGKTFYYVDFDANGWPQTGRDKAVDLVRRCFAVHLCGDQHLATIGQYGIEAFRDSSWWFCVPSIANLWPRWWEPDKKPLHPAPGATQPYTGDYLDGFGNRMTIYAHTNPHKTGRKPAVLHDRMPGFGIVRFDKQKRTITMECWPRMTDPTDPNSRQYTGWPRTISQFDNYSRKAVGWLPTIKVRGADNPVVMIENQATGELVYAVRILGDSFKPRVFEPGTYSITVATSKARRHLKNIASAPHVDSQTLVVEFP